MSLNRFIPSITENIDTVVHVGAGYCSDVKFYRNLGIKSIVLIEADKNLVETASKKFASAKDIKIHHRAIAGVTGERTLFLTNNQRFSSLLKPRHILKTYPNLKLTGEHPVSAASLADMCGELQLPPKGKHLLVLELNGEEIAVFENTTVDTFARFKWIIVRGCDPALYGTGSEHTLPESMQKSIVQIYDTLCFKEDIETFQFYLLIRNDKALENRMLSAENETALKKLATATGALQEFQLSKKRTQQKLEGLRQALAQSKKINKHLTKERNETQIRLGESEAVLETHKSRLGNYIHELDKITQQNNTLSSENTNYLEQISELEQKLQSTQFDLNNTNKQIIELTNLRFQKQISDLADKIQLQLPGESQTNDRIVKLQNENFRLLQQVDKITNSNAITKRALNDALEKAGKLEQGKVELERRIIELNGRLRESKSAYNRVDEANKVSTKQLQELTKENERDHSKLKNLSGLLTEAKTEAANANQQLAEMSRNCSDLQKEIEKLKTEHSKTKATLQSKQDEVNSLQTERAQQVQQIKSLTEQLKQYSLEVKEANDALRINNKLVAKTDADLRDLQSRYQKTIENRADQEKLLSALQQKLLQASEFYQQLHLQGEEATGDIFNPDFEEIESKNDV